ncbi:MAG: DUF4290 domain-containing protein [Alloprevotella sp.]|nr:DUF4290 domain-containing protein [Bacteroidales bacterium]MDY3943317.1 DUF4290 domain-containing protein [Alloprevotella sp.]
MDYNTSRTKLLLPEYGRLIQEMVAEALHIENKEERQAYAELIIYMMANVAPDAKQAPNYVHKLWEHLAFIANYELDIDYPVEISKEAMFQKPESVPYPTSSTRFRHYGNITESWVKKIAEMPEGVEREQQMILLANYMKRSLLEHRGGYVSDEKIAHDLEVYADGQLKLDLTTQRLVAIAPPVANKKH